MPLRPYLVSGPSLTDASVLLRIQVANTDSISTQLRSTRILVANGILWIMSDQAPWQEVRLDGLTVANLVEKIHARIPGVLISSDYPHLPAVLLTLRPARFVAPNGVEIYAEPNRLGVMAEFGMLMRMRTSQDPNNASVLEDIGLTADLVGELAPTETIRVRSRLGFGIGSGANQAIPESAEAGSAYLTPVLRTANQVVLGFQVDKTVYSFAKTRLFASFELGGAWSTGVALSQPEIRAAFAEAMESTGDARLIGADSLIDSLDVVRVQQGLNRIRGAASAMVYLGWDAHDDDRKAAYFLLGVGFLGRPLDGTPQVSVAKISPVDPQNPNRVDFTLHGSRLIGVRLPHVRFAGGVKVARFLNIGISVDKPLGADERDAGTLIRFQLLTDFPVVR
jgi:hypothetical protein